ncbi:glycosyl hydrolase, family 31 protein [Trypanosoma theileri]|uniref:Glycosyl hydrolase, family 31 protein n=1 Tax=Trypanosoma theileri TaxID=67003 RepID=A0A1X0NXL1_9TRYP|nr:glycosyl hydrolase, family 31 protein [Trypanosoma theileri]ORC89424.1 glycosyl hydrolase, family 31 protein [Trypanosoma theileri]
MVSVRRRRRRDSILLALFVFWIVVFLIRQLLRRIDYENEAKELDKKIISYINRYMKLPIAAYPPWIHGLWLHVPATIYSVDGILEFVQQFNREKIGIGVVLVEHGRNLFMQNPSETFHFKSLVEQLHVMGFHVVTSVDSFVRHGTQEFWECKKRSLLLLAPGGESISWQYTSDGITTNIFKGGLLDFTNAEALQWYHQRLDQIFQTGVNGLWNEAMDGVLSSAFGHGVQGWSGFVDSAIYANDYYYQTFDYGREKNGFNFITSFLPVDSLSPVSIPRPFGPTDISFVTFIRSYPFSFSGLEDALFSLEQSLERGYINVGVEPRGLLEGGVEAALRWMQLMALCPVTILPSQLKEQAKAQFPAQFESFFLEIEKLTQMHEMLRPYYFSLGSLTFFHQFHQQNKTEQKAPIPFVMQPVQVGEGVNEMRGFCVGTELFFVPVIAPAILNGEDLQAVQRFSVSFPTDIGPWQPHTDSQLPPMVYPGGSTAQFTINVTQMLLFQRCGGIIPMRTPSIPDVLTFLIESPHLSLYPTRYVPFDEMERELVNGKDKEFVIFYSEEGKRHLLWYSVELVEHKFWLNFNGTTFGKKTILCVRGSVLAEEVDENGYEKTNSINHFSELVASDTSAMFSTEEKNCFYSSIMAIESVARIGPFNTNQ